MMRKEERKREKRGNGRVTEKQGDTGERREEMRETDKKGREEGRREREG